MLSVPRLRVALLAAAFVCAAYTAHGGGFRGQVEIAWWKSRGFSSTVYATHPTGDLRLYHRRGRSGSSPAVLLIHGGGWRGGRPRELADLAQYFDSLGYATLLAEYRVFSREGTFPAAAVRDVSAAYRYIVANASDLGVDRDAVAVAGSSAGGHLAFWAARRAHGSPYPVKAVVMLSAVTDISDAGYRPADLGPDLEALSPLSHIVAGLPPVLILHSRDDHLVPYAGAVAFTEAGVAAGNEVDLLTVAGDNHGFFLGLGVHRSLKVETGERFPEAASAFLERNLRGHRNPRNPRIASGSGR